MSINPHYTNLRLTQDKKDRYFVVFYINNKRYRYANGKSIHLNIKPNAHTGQHQNNLAIELLSSFKRALDEGWSPTGSNKSTCLYTALIKYSPISDLSEKYRRALVNTAKSFSSFLLDSKQADLSFKNLNGEHISLFLESTNSTTSSYNHEKARVSSILGSLLDDLSLPNPCGQIKPKKVKPALHKPFKDVNLLLEDIKSFNENLFLCCLLTYGCLLRPHQEIRNLKWGDFSEDMKHISLSGKRNKSGRNRIVPIPEYISKHLHKGLDTDNIFTGKEKPFNSDYFKTLWRRYKAQSNVLEELQTLYSFRHSGAIEIYKRTGSVTILQSAMGHASLAVTLGYLRGLEIPSLKLEDMPRL